MTAVRSQQRNETRQKQTESTGRLSGLPRTRCPYSISKVLTTSGPFSDEEFAPSEDVISSLSSVKILVIGAGGLGCEILKNLALSGFTDIHVIDMDTIDISNLNRQFLFRPSDVGKPKAEVAANFVNKRVKGCHVTPHYAKIQDFDDDFYMQFTLVVCGLDSIEARRWINATLVNLVEDSPETLKPLVDGGTEGFKGQSRVILPTITSCYECSLDMLTKQTTYPMCTIANTPRLPEHCVEWASVLEWPKHFDRKCDNDSVEDVTWLFEAARSRAEEFGIEGVTFQLTQGVIKNIIPAIASTNAIIAASCCNEAFKVATTCVPFLNNYMMYSGDNSVYTYTFEHQKRPDCPVCGIQVMKYVVKKGETLENLIERLREDPAVKVKNPSLRTASKSLYMAQPKELEEMTRGNLVKGVEELVGEEEVVVTDEQLPFSLRLVIEQAD
ncbi:NEDD8-activating enzyme E1 catalytic subunit [Yarrowia sp. B02]|nr:NEDD8-activating enzyme E1 catalytic subunit [Yarrowia sp. B02]